MQAVHHRTMGCRQAFGRPGLAGAFVTCSRCLIPGVRQQCHRDFTIHAHMKVPMNTKKLVLPLLVSLVTVGTFASLAATKTPMSDTPLDGKFVIVSQPGVIHGVHGNARFESVGQTDFVVVPMQHTDTTVIYDYWIPLKDVSLLQVFHSQEDANDYIARRDKPRQASSDR